MTSGPELREGIRPVVRTTQIIVAAMCMGLLTFAVIVIFISRPEEPPPIGAGQPVAPAEAPREYFMVYLAAAMWATTVPMGWTISQATVRNGRRKIVSDPNSPMTPPMPAAVESLGDAGRLAMLYQTKTIIFAACLEGPGFFGLVTAMMEGPYAFAVPAASLAGLALLFPTTERIAAWIEQQMQLLDDERSMTAE